MNFKTKYEKVFKDYLETFNKTLNLNVDVKLVWSNRMTASAGIAELTWDRKEQKYIKPTIKLSTKIYSWNLDNHIGLCNTIVHELGHIFIGMTTNVYNGHNLAWKELTESVSGISVTRLHSLRVWNPETDTRETYLQKRRDAYWKKKFRNAKKYIYFA